jgi:alpha-N-arabinofuranosidase
VVSITLCNLDPNNSQKVNFELTGQNPVKVSGKVVTASKINSYNDFGRKAEVFEAEFKDLKITNGRVEAILPSKSVVLIQMQ